MFEHLLRHFLRIFYLDGRAFVYGVMSIGAMAVTLMVAVSDTPVYITLQRSIPWIFLTCLPWVVLLLASSKKTMARSEILNLLENNEKNCVPILREFGVHILGFIVLMIWAGWLLFGTFLLLVSGELWK